MHPTKRLAAAARTAKADTSTLHINNTEGCYWLYCMWTNTMHCDHNILVSRKLAGGACQTMQAACACLLDDDMGRYKSLVCHVQNAMPPNGCACAKACKQFRIDIFPQLHCGVDKNAPLAASQQPSATSQHVRAVR